MKNDWRVLDPLLIALWSDFTISADEIGRRLGGVTKNAVIGRAHRLGLAKRQMGFKVKKPKKPKPEKTVQESVPIIPAKEMPKRDRFGHFLSAKSPEKTLLPKRDARGHFLSVVEEVKVEEIIPAKEWITILELTHRTCRWPKGDRPPFLYCGRPPFDDLVYCEEHSRIAFAGKAPKYVGRISSTTGGQF